MNTILAGPHREETTSGLLLCFSAARQSVADCFRWKPPNMGYSGCGRARFGTSTRTAQAEGGKRMPSDVRRRDFMALLGGALTSPPISAHAQQARTQTVGVLMGLANDAEARARIKAFEQGLEQEGWSAGQNLRIEYRFAEGDSRRAQAFAKELVELSPGCILAHSTPIVATLVRATRTIPIVFVAVSDPIGSGSLRAWRVQARTSQDSPSSTQPSPENMYR